MAGSFFVGMVEYLVGWLVLMVGLHCWLVNLSEGSSISWKVGWVGLGSWFGWIGLLVGWFGLGSWLLYCLLVDWFVWLVWIVVRFEWLCWFDWFWLFVRLV